MPAKELIEWEAFYQLRPFGSWRDNYHSAQIAHILFNANRDPKRSKEKKLADFLWRDPVEARRREQKEQELETVAWFDARVKNG